MEVKDMITLIIGLMTGGATVVLAVITWRYVRLTRDILEENRQMRLDAQKPEIAIYLRSEKTASFPNQPKITSMFLYVENIRLGPAYDVEFTTDLSFSVTSGHSLREVGFLEHGIRYLPPGQKRKYLLANEYYPDFDELMQKQLKIMVAYKDSVNEKYECCFYLDFQAYRGE